MHGAERRGQGAPRLLQMVLVTITQYGVSRRRRDYVVQGAGGGGRYTHMAWGWNLNATGSSRIRLFSSKRACSIRRVKIRNRHSQ